MNAATSSVSSSATQSTAAPGFFASVTSNVHYRADLDGLRALAVLSVVTVHVAPAVLPCGGVGVDIFFVLSGYLISGILIRSARSGSLSLAEFYYRRTRRIFPALILVLIFVLGFARFLFLPDEYARLGMDVAAGSTFVLNLVWYGDVDQYYSGIPLLNHLWTLGVEEQFYLAWPVFILCTSRFRRYEPALMSVVTVLSFIVFCMSSTYDTLAALTPWNRLWELSIGGVIAAWQQPSVRLPTAVLNSMSICGLALLILTLSGMAPGSSQPVLREALPVAGTSLIIWAGPASLANRYILSRTPLVFLGLISFPLYLWHFPLIGFAELLIPRDWRWVALGSAVALSLLLASLTYLYVELLIRAAGGGRRLAGVLIAALLACSMIGYGAHRIPLRLETPALAEISRAVREDWLTAHRSNGSWTESVSGFLQIPGGPRRTLFIGDSNMQQYYPRIVALLGQGEPNAHTAVFAARNWCVPSLVDLAPMTHATRDSCQAFLRKTLEYARGEEVDTIVIAACWYFYFVDFGGVDNLGASAPMKPAADRALPELQQLLQGWVRGGKRVFLVLNTPVGNDFDPHRMVQRLLQPPGFRITSSYPARSQVQSAIGPVDTALREVANASGASVIDPLDWLCDDKDCPAVSNDGSPRYRDRWRLRPTYVEDHVHYLDFTVQ